MDVEMAIWRMTDDGPHRLEPSPLDREQRLEDMLVEDPGMIVNSEQQFTIVASELDPTSDRIVEFLAGSYGVPINAVFFRHFSDDSRAYLART